ncbi:MAG: Hsp20/alpha crystallin family protein [Planctomycetota bacterium]|nr:Hsp20/alpha crystallin family protein [Planctomycetota bacterium]
MFRNRNFGYWPLESIGEHIARLNNEFNRVITRGWRETERAFPAFNIWSNAEGAVLAAELPGVKVEDIELTVSGNVVTIKGSRKNLLAGDDKYVRRERQEGEFVRTFELPFQVEPAKVKAESAKGILRLELPRAEADKPKRIEVRSA